jgi:putative transposase
VANEPRFADQPPARIVPTLADEGVYIASESSFQRVLRAHGQTRHRGRSRAPQRSRTPSTHVAAAPGQVWCWDMTYLPTQVQGRWFYLYLIQDLYSRKIVGWEIHDADDADHAVSLLKRTALAEGIHAMTEKPVLHGDNGSTLKATTVLAMLQLARASSRRTRARASPTTTPSSSHCSRPQSTDPQFPVRGFADLLEGARLWGRRLRALVQLRTSAQRHPLRHARRNATPVEDRDDSGRASPDLPAGPRTTTRGAGPG